MTTCFGLLLSHWCYKLRNFSDTLFHSTKSSKEKSQDPNNTIYESILSSNVSEVVPTNVPHVLGPVRSLDVIIPSKSGILDGDWYLKQANPKDTSAYPWQKTRSYLNFELVPWRKPRPQTRDIPEPEVIERDNSEMLIKWNEQEEDKILKKLHKLGQKSEKSSVITRRSSKKGNNNMKLHKKNNVKVKLIFEMEMKNRHNNQSSSLYATKPKIKTRTFEKRAKMRLKTPDYGGNDSSYDPWQKDTEAVYVAIKELESKRNHWGYFSQRNININELINDKFSSVQTQGTINTSTSGKMSEYKRLSANKKVNRSKAIVTYCFVDNGKYSKHFCTKCKR